MRVKKSDFNTLPLSEHFKTVDVSIRYTNDEMVQIQQGAKPASMDDRWLIYFEEETLFLHRSWTGACIFMLKFRSLEEGQAEAYQLSYVDDKHLYCRISNDEDKSLVQSIIQNILLA